MYDYLIRGDPTEKIIDLLSLTGEEKVLEIGAGTGRSIASVMERNQLVWLLDPSLAMLKQAKTKYPNAKLFLGYAENLPFYNIFFDRILAIDTLHHWDDPVLGLREIARVIEPKNGLLLVVEINPSTKVGHFIKSFEKLLFMGSTFFTPKELRKIHILAGLTVIRQMKLDGGSYLTLSRKKVK
ncbi:MAG: class I SAM-dependent methyltransferase [Candidatus Hodarchaeales archaeon]|jgi:ubiquinone/menaquinone biosynthesis C-methylase UbiE